MLTELLAIRIVWEEALSCPLRQRDRDGWANARRAYAGPLRPQPMTSWTPSSRRPPNGPHSAALPPCSPRRRSAGVEGRPAIQAAFCIDVRSEVFRRALEAPDPADRDIGFAGFFGLGAAHRRFASDVKELRLPVLLNPGVTSATGAPSDKEQDLAARYAARAQRAWGRFKLAAVSSFAFVEATGPVYAGKLVRDALGFGSPEQPDSEAPRFGPRAAARDARGDGGSGAARHVDDRRTSPASCCSSVTAHR